MKAKSKTARVPATAGSKVIKDIRRGARQVYSAEEKIRIVLNGLRGESSIAEPFCIQAQDSLNPPYHDTEKGLSWDDRARLMAPAMMLPVLYGFQAAISELRDEMTMDPERRAKETQHQKYFKWASRAGMFGAADHTNCLGGCGYKRTIVIRIPPKAIND